MLSMTNDMRDLGAERADPRIGRDMTERNRVIRAILGDIESQAAGVTLIHEHVHMDMTPTVQALDTGRP